MKIASMFLKEPSAGRASLWEDLLLQACESVTVCREGRRASERPA